MRIQNYLRTVLPLLALSAGAHAGLIAHYDFSDGNLFDNELGASHTLTQQQKNGGTVSLNTVDGTAVFAGGRADGGVNDAIGWLETAGPGALDDFTVSFWFRTGTVDQGHAYQGLFSSGSSGVLAGNWQVHSDGEGGAPNLGELNARFDGNGVSYNGAPLHTANTWYHVVVRKDNDEAQPISLHLTAITAGAIGTPVFQSANNDITLGKFVLGVNRGANMSYGMEMANVRIFDDSDISLEALYDEGVTAGPLPIPAVVIDFASSGDYVAAGSSVTLSWEVLQADEVSITPGVGDVTSLTTNGVGQTNVTINTTTTFTITAANDDGSDQREITVHVGPPPPVINSFTASDHYVEAGTEVTLAWDTANGTSVTLTPQPGVVAASGSTIATITGTTTFTLTASNVNGSAEQDLTVHCGPARPNIVIFLVDDMGPMDTSVPFVFDGRGNPVSYNFNNLYVTPHMEALAANGMRFSNAYAQPTCSPTRVSLMTGLNTTGHAVTSWVNDNGTRQGQYAPANYRSHGIEDPNEETLPKWLSAAGYRTIHTGKGHFTDQHDASVYDEVEDPRFIGFDVNIGGSWQGQPGSYFGTANYANSGRPEWLIPGLEDHHGTDTYLSEALTIEANEVISETVARGQPFFLYMSHYAVHAPFMLDPRASGDYSALSGTNLNFATMLEGMDLSLGEIIAHLDAEGVAEDTLILFLGDNGSDNRLLNDNALPDAPYNDYPLRGMKGNRSEGGSRIPMIAAWAKPDASNPFQQALSIPAGSVEHDIVACWDLPVTIMNAAGVAIPASAHTHGYDLSPYLRGTPGTHREQELIIYYPHGRDNNDHFANYREGDWKLTYLWEEERHLLFNLANDPTESNDLATSNPEKVLQMARGMARQFDQEWGTAFGTIWPTYPAAGQGELSTSAIMGTLDLDGDGRMDSDEDTNANGLVDSGETSPDDADTDTDGTDDHSEVRLGLDPLDPTEFFRLSVWDTGTGKVELRWPSQPGLTFKVRRNTDLDSPVSSWPADSDIPAAPDSGETMRSYPLDALRKFFAVELE